MAIDSVGGLATTLLPTRAEPGVSDDRTGRRPEEDYGSPATVVPDRLPTPRRGTDAYRVAANPNPAAEKEAPLTGPLIYGRTTAHEAAARALGLQLDVTG